MNLKNKIINIAILSLLTCPYAYAGLNLDFLRGGLRNNVPDILKDDVKYPSGQYIVDVVFNRKQLGKELISISADENQALCLSEDFISNLSLPIDLAQFDSYFDLTNLCYVLEDYPGVKIDFDYGAQTLNISVPQVVIDDSRSNQNWDYGINGLKVNYSGYVNKTSSNKTQYYGDFDIYANVDRWVGYVKTNYTKDSGSETSEATLSTAIRQIKGNFIVGKTSTVTTFSPSFMFYGMALRSDSNMKPWELRGYAPIVSGVANSNAKITISQNGYVLSSEIVPAGAYQLKNISPVSNGYITVTVEEENGTKTVRQYPVTTLPTLLRTNDMNYNVVFGQREVAGHRETDPFLLGSFDYGLEYFTFHGEAVLHEKYKSAGLGVSKDFGKWGGVSLFVNGSRSIMQPQAPTSTDNRQTGISFQAKYATSIANDTNLQLIGYHYTGRDYIDFADYNQESLYHFSQRKGRYETILSQNFDDSFISLSGWLQTYRNDIDEEAGVSVTYNTVLKGIDLSLSADYQKINEYARDNYTLSLGINIPFSLFGQNHYNNTSVSYDRQNKTTFNTGFSGSISDRVNYSVNSSKNRDSFTNSAYLGTDLDYVNMGFAVSQTKSHTSGAINASGSLIVTEPTGIIFSNVRRDTVAIASIKDLGDVRFNDSPPTNSRGHTVIPVSPYINNDIKINTEEVPNDVELLDTVHSFTPTDKSIVYREFKYADVQRFILRIKRRDESLVPVGSLARTPSGENIGFVSNGGVLLLNLLNIPEFISLSSPHGEQCQFAMKSIAANTNKITEIYCDE